jgi:hypothetical protein
MRLRDRFAREIRGWDWSRVQEAARGQVPNYGRHVAVDLGAVAELTPSRDPSGYANCSACSGNGGRDHPELVQRVRRRDELYMATDRAWERVSMRVGAPAWMIGADQMTPGEIAEFDRIRDELDAIHPDGDFVQCPRCRGCGYLDSERRRDTVFFHVAQEVARRRGAWRLRYEGGRVLVLVPPHEDGPWITRLRHWEAATGGGVDRAPR